MGYAAVRLAVAISVLAAVAALAGCGSSQTTKPATKLSIDIEDFGQQTQVSIPKTIDAGVHAMVFTNRAKGQHSMQLIRYDAPHSPPQVLKAGRAWGEHGKPLPPWVHLAGGFGAIKEGETSQGTVRLQTGLYVAVDLEARGQPVYGAFNAVGKPSSSPLPSTQGGSIKAREYAFDANGLKAGANKVLLENTGKQPHMLAAAPIKKGKTIADVRRYAKSQKGASPLEESKGVDTGILDPRQRELIQLDLQPGRYALLCFVPDREGGKPHVLKGMISEATVR